MRKRLGTESHRNQLDRPDTFAKKESPALFINSKIEKALSPKFPTPTFEGREDICKNRPAARLFNQGATIILIRHNAYCAKNMCH